MLQLLSIIVRHLFKPYITYRLSALPSRVLNTAQKLILTVPFIGDKCRRPSVLCKGSVALFHRAERYFGNSPSLTDFFLRCGNWVPGSLIPRTWCPRWQHSKSLLDSMLSFPLPLCPWVSFRLEVRFQMKTFLSEIASPLGQASLAAGLRSLTGGSVPTTLPWPQAPRPRVGPLRPVSCFIISVSFQGSFLPLLLQKNKKN